MTAYCWTQQNDNWHLNGYGPLSICFFARKKRKEAEIDFQISNSEKQSQSESFDIDFLRQLRQTHPELNRHIWENTPAADFSPCPGIVRRRGNSTDVGVLKGYQRILLARILPEKIMLMSI